MVDVGPIQRFKSYNVNVGGERLFTQHVQVLVHSLDGFFGMD